MDLTSLLADTALWGLLLGLITPALTAVAQQPWFAKKTRHAVGVGVSVVVGLLTVLADGQLANGGVTVATVLAVVAAAEASYKAFWQPTGVAGAIEWTTTPGSGLPKADPEIVLDEEQF